MENTETFWQPVNHEHQLIEISELSFLRAAKLIADVIHMDAINNELNKHRSTLILWYGWSKYKCASFTKCMF